MQMKWLGGLGVGAIVGLLLVAPVTAQSFNQSDVTGTNVSNGPSTFGVSNSSGLLARLFSLISALIGRVDGLIALLQQLLGTVGYSSTGELVAAGPKQLAQSQFVRKETLDALVSLRTYLDSLNTQSNPNLKALDNYIRPVAGNLSQDLKAAEASCQAQGGTGPVCDAYTEFSAATVEFLDALDAVDQELRRAVPIARTY